LRADRLGAYGSTRALTPAIDALAARSVVFTSAYAPASFTVPSLAALMTGRYPEELGIWTNESAFTDSVPTLAGVLTTHGWYTSAVVSNWVIRSGPGLERGFAHYDDTYPDMEASRMMPERRAQATTDAALAALERCLTPCFLWVHYQDPHGPYTPPEDLRARYLAREREAPDGRRLLPEGDHNGFGGIPGYQQLGDEREVAFYRSGYDAEVRHLDEHIGRFLEAFEARGFAERAVIVFAADHGESLGEDDCWFAHGALLSDVLVRVPLFVRVPGAVPGRRDELVSLVDVLPTLLPLLTGKPAEDERPGRDLFAPGAAARPSRPYLANLGDNAVPQWAVVEGDYKLLVEERDGDERVRLLRRGDDAEVIEPLPEVRARLDASLRATRSALRRKAETRQMLSPFDRERMKALGYAD
jgi:arylsulfatase A-like enzyme